LLVEWRQERPVRRSRAAPAARCETVRLGGELELRHEALELLGGRGELLRRRGDLLGRRDTCSLDADDSSATAATSDMSWCIWLAF
jgi:hypothetical protein